MEDRVIDPKQKGDDKKVERSLRPKNLSEVIGCNKEKNALRMMIDAAKSRGEAIDHILFHGPPGLGKTSLSYVVASEMNVPIYTTSGPAIERQGDLAAILTNIPENGVLFIDEIHRLNRSVEEILYPAMEDQVIDIIIGKGPSAKTLRLDLNFFTIIGATTRMSLVTAPLRDRFGINLRLDFYSFEELAELVLAKAKLLGLSIEPDAAVEISRRARRTPRIAERLLKRVRDFADVNNNSIITKKEALDTLKILEIDSMGLDYIDRKLLETLIKKFNGGPIGLSTLAASINEDLLTVEEVYEPYLIREGLLIRTPKGRKVTERAIKHLVF